jgi:hypothetical protein
LFPANLPPFAIRGGWRKALFDAGFSSFATLATHFEKVMKTRVRGVCEKWWQGWQARAWGAARKFFNCPS